MKSGVFGAPDILVLISYRNYLYIEHHDNGLQSFKAA